MPNSVQPQPEFPIYDLEISFLATEGVDPDLVREDVLKVLRERYRYLAYAYVFKQRRKECLDKAA